jgi:hypothetical protein
VSAHAQPFADGLPISLLSGRGLVFAFLFLLGGKKEKTEKKEKEA